MLFGNCVRRINKIQITKCFQNSVVTTKHLHVTMASRLQHSMHPDRCSHTTASLTDKVSVFTNCPQNNRDRHQHIDLCGRGHRFYSSQKHNANADHEDDDDMVNWSRKLPKFDTKCDHHTTPSIYLMVKNTLSGLLIRSYFDQQFNKQEFLDGAKQAVQVVSNLLAEPNFDELHGMVDDDTIAKMRQIVGSMTPEQRQWIVVNEEDVQWIFPYEIQFITKENTLENKSRFFVEIMVVIHAYRDTDVELSDLIGKPNAEVMKKLETNYSVANYRFIKEFTKGVDDDWTINYINHVKPTDEMKEKEKLFKES